MFSLPGPPLLPAPITLGHVPKALRLQRGQRLQCTAGCLWITSDALAGLGPDSDVVLESGQCFVTRQAAIYFVGAPLGYGVLSVLSSVILTRRPLEATC
jgi:hypothetical protein